MVNGLSSKLLGFEAKKGLSPVGSKNSISQLTNEIEQLHSLLEKKDLEHKDMFSQIQDQ